MNLYSPKTVKELLKAHSIKPNQRLGQNFLLEKKATQKMIKASNISPKDTILEIGPGIGTLTRELAQTAKQVLAVEKDSLLVDILKETLVDINNVEVVLGDALKFNPKNQPYKVVANLPYYITSPIIRMFLEQDTKPELLVLMVQKEVAQRICARPPDMNLLAVSVQFYATPTVIASVRRGSFWPQPKVDSAILKIVPHNKKPLVSSKEFFSVVKSGFKQPRKQLANNLTQGLNLSRIEVESWLKANNIQPTQRAETLSLKDWISLTQSFKRV